MGSGQSKSRILVVDDDLQTLKLLRFLLQDEGYEVFVASSGAVARGLMSNPANPVHLIILDVMMPNLDGFDLCTQIREAGETIPIIFLSARREPADRTEGLRAGADDYISKPFDPGELLARISAVMRRTQSAVAAVESLDKLKLGDIELDPMRLKVRVADSRLADLTPTETKLLHCLMRNSGRVLPREVLISQVWDYDYDGFNNTVDVYVRRLRKKIELDPDEPKYIRTVRGAGYVFQKSDQ